MEPEDKSWTSASLHFRYDGLQLTILYLTWSQRTRVGLLPASTSEIMDSDHPPPYLEPEDKSWTSAGLHLRDDGLQLNLHHLT